MQRTRQRRRGEGMISAQEIACFAYWPEQWRLQYGLRLEPGNRAFRAFRHPCSPGFQTPLFPGAFRHPCSPGLSVTDAGRGLSDTLVPRGFQSPTRGGVRKGYAAHSWRSELVLVSDNTQRTVLSSVFAPVRPEINFQVDEFSQGQVTTPRLPEALDGPCPILGGHDVRY
jgi:hypothetical protein